MTAAVFSLLTAGAFAQVKKTTAPVKKPVTKTAAKPAAILFKNNIDSISYAIGMRIAQNLDAQGFKNLNMSLFQKAMSDIKLKKAPLLNDDAVTSCISLFQQKISAEKEAEMRKENEAKAAINKKEGMAFLAANGKRAGVVTLPSGLQYEVLKAGTDNTKPVLTSRVTCHYTGTLINGTKFDSSVDRGTPATFGLSNVISGWQEALQLMTVGSKWKLFIPSNLAYGDNAPPNIGPGATLIFEVELLGVQN